jgi:hypothetical protein
MEALRNDFSAVDQDGPIRAAEFHSGTRDDRDRIRQAVVTVGRFLLSG